jgi:hypothetical protein
VGGRERVTRDGTFGRWSIVAILCDWSRHTNTKMVNKLQIGFLLFLLWNYFKNQREREREIRWWWCDVFTIFQGEGGGSKITLLFFFSIFKCFIKTQSQRIA